ncbi:MAG: HDOD domain-containing protein [Halorhodospira halophila]|uniref:HDOD domain-containing protein n=1 Tax=Halorhodospira TaxID=85108 RepID=UPI0019142085|nr:MULTISPECIES: HDOD domain-containing protein [Halorhodospira]MBK5936627.1 histidine kinase [Halorhodospira halophila]MBK5944515.1 histidine kinase [Halorhodospira halophila]MCC3750777.1 HDOD domain-containing protein [Halorhodospira halophila]MCG5527362.1 HDOD domain-containing protein [Halorhodospira halophila]MCG5539118.1 HDOD domain-containing protein [Halorhodospira sp. 9622]
MGNADRVATLERLGDSETLPALPYVAHDILVATSHNEVNISDVAETLAREPGLAARIVAIANYAFFSRRETVYSLEQAIMRIGLNRVRVLATSLLLNELFRTAQCPHFQLQRYWHEALGTAFCAARLAPDAAPRESRDAAYLGGVLHSIGLLLLVHIFPQTMDEILAEHEADPERSLAGLTYQALGCDYGEAGALLLREWSIPEPIAVATENAHRDRYEGPHADLVATIRFANEWLQRGFDPEQCADAPPIPQRKLERVSTACREEYEALAAFAQLLSGDD